MNEELTILLVDDDEVDQEAVCRALRPVGLADRVVIASDGIEALERLRGTATRPPLAHPYLILLDLNMPRMSGFEFLRALRDDPELAASIVFVLTTSSRDQDRAAAYGLKVAGFMSKATVGADFKLLASLVSAYVGLVDFPG